MLSRSLVLCLISPDGVRLRESYVPQAVELLRQGKNEELWQMCCGYLKLDLDQFMTVQKRLLEEQLLLLGDTTLGRKIMKGARPRTLEQFREQVPLTTYADYCPELEEQREDTLSQKPALWAHSSGRSGKYEYKWIPITKKYAEEMSKLLYGIGMISCSDHWGDTSQIPRKVKILYSVAPRPYISGTFADLLRMQTPLVYMPSIEESESLTFEERLKLGFEQSISKGLDYFFGISLVLVTVGEKFLASSKDIDITQYLNKPAVLWRLLRGKLKSKLAGRALLPKDIWAIRGIIGSGLDSWVYKNRVQELWGRRPLDIYSCTEGGLVATQTWDYEGMTFIPNLNFLEFIPEEESLKWQMDRSYQPKTVLLDGVEPGKSYEIIFTNFHGGSLVRYQIGDMIKIVSNKNERNGIETPQMVFDRRVDDIIDFFIIRLTEKTIWEAINNTGIEYVDWVAFKETGNLTLKIMIELKNNRTVQESVVAENIYRQIMNPHNIEKADMLDDGYIEAVGFNIKVELLPEGTFSRYTTRMEAAGSDLAHIKPPHLNPSDKVLSVLMGEPEEIIVVTKNRSQAEPSREIDSTTEKIVK
jgi:hypothetical protein